MKKLNTLIVYFVLFSFVLFFSTSCEKDKVVEEYSNLKNKGARLPGETEAASSKLNMFLKVNDIAVANGSIVSVRLNVQFKVQPWFWTLDSQNQRVEFEAGDVSTWVPPSGVEYTQRYIRRYPNGGFGPSGARGYTLRSNIGGGELRVAAGAGSDAAYINIAPLLDHVE